MILDINIDFELSKKKLSLDVRSPWSRPWHLIWPPKYLEMMKSCGFSRELNPVLQLGKFWPLNNVKNLELGWTMYGAYEFTLSLLSLHKSMLLCLAFSLTHLLMSIVSNDLMSIWDNMADWFINQSMIICMQYKAHTYLSMTSLLMHTIAHSTRPSFRPKTNNQLLKKFLSLAVSWVKVVKNGKILTFKVNFLCQKLSESF